MLRIAAERPASGAPATRSISEDIPMAILPNFGAATFVPGAPIDNPYFPLIPGRVLSYQGDETDPETGEVTTERNDLFTTSATFEVRGVATTVIRDTVYEDDVIIEDTFDWYAQDTAGNVWYFGEIVMNYEYDDEGNFIGVNHDGEWSADDPGNQPGWAMKASPEFGPAYYLRICARHRRGREHHRRDRAQRRDALRAL